MTIPPDFPWRPGMLLPSGARVEVVEDDDESNIYINGERLLRSYIEPDPTDGPTLGALEAAVAEDRKAWRLWSAWDPDDGRWYVWMIAHPGHAAQVVGAAGDRFYALLAAWNARPK